MKLSRMAVLPALLASACAATPEPEPEPRWWKGNLHTHSLWTDGADYPEMIAAWYHERGYHFLGVTEHDMLQEGGARWLDIDAPDPGWPPRNASASAALPGYLERFGASWVEQRDSAGHTLVRLRPLSEYRHRFEQASRFMFLHGEEITDRGGAHINAFNLDAAILPRGGATSAERTRNNLAAVAERRQASGRPVFAIVNHPNFLWTLTAPEIAAIPDARLFEVYNGHFMTNSAGDSTHPATDQMWDIMLTQRHQLNAPPIYGVATDDAHEFRAYSDSISMPGRGWVMVRARELTPEAISNAIAAGDFYASTGVVLRDVERDGRALRIAIDAEPGLTYRTQFIGTRVGSNVMGEVLREVTGSTAEYVFAGDERYVRAKIVSDRAQVDPVRGKVIGLQTAWVQP